MWQGVPELYQVFFFNVLVALRLCCCKQAFFSGGEWGLLSSCGVQTSCSGFSCCGAQALGSQASAVVAQGLSCSVGCGIFLDQGSNPWQADSYPVHHQGSPGSTKSWFSNILGFLLWPTFLTWRQSHPGDAGGYCHILGVPEHLLQSSTRHFLLISSSMSFSAAIFPSLAPSCPLILKDMDQGPLNT